MMTPDRDSPCYGAISVTGNPKDNLEPEFMMLMALVCSCFGFASDADTFACALPSVPGADLFTVFSITTARSGKRTRHV